MATDNTHNYMLNGVTALYPRLDRTYRFDSTEQRSVPCDALENGAEYSTKFKMDNATAKSLYAFMATLYEGAKEANWPEFPKPAQLFNKEEDGSWSYKTSLKGAYNGEKTKKPMQCDAKTKPLPADFQLTSGSIVNLAVVGIPYSTRLGSGVSLRLRGVQVLKLAERAERSPFEATDGFEFDAGNPFSVAAAPAAAPVADDDFGDEAPAAKPAASKAAALEAFESGEIIPEPVKRPNKKAEAAPAKAKDPLADVINEWTDAD